MTTVTELKMGFEGYGPVNKDGHFPQPIPGITFYDYFPVEGMFSVVYREIEQPDKSESSFSFLIDKSDAICLEYLLKKEAIERSMRSETYYCEKIFLTCISGSNPLISFPCRGFSIRFRYDKDYDDLLQNVTKFLDSTILNEQEEELRGKLQKKLEQ